MDEGDEFFDVGFGGGILREKLGTGGANGVEVFENVAAFGKRAGKGWDDEGWDGAVWVDGDVVWLQVFG